MLTWQIPCGIMTLSMYSASAGVPSLSSVDPPFCPQDGAPTPELQGLIPNSFEHIFQEVEASSDKQWMVRASYLEIYNEEVGGHAWA